MAKAQNDLYMVCPEADKNDTGDNTLSAIEVGTLTIGELQRNAMNICSFLMHTHAYERMNGERLKVEVLGADESFAEAEGEVVYYKIEDREITISLHGVDTKKGSCFVFALDLENIGIYDVQIKAKSELTQLAQIPITLIRDGVPAAVFTFNGTDGEWASMEKKIILNNKYAVLQLYFGQNGLEAEEIRFTLAETLPA